jgi:hypothetical protein
MVGLIQSGQLKTQDPQALQAVSSPAGGQIGQEQPPMNAEPTGQPTGQMAGQVGGQDESKVPTADEQESYEKVVLAGMKMMYDPSLSPKLVEMLKSGADEPAKTLAKVAMVVFNQIDEKSGGTVPEIVVAHSVDALLEETITFANESGVMQVDEKTAAQARSEMLMSIADQFGVEPEDVQDIMGSYPPEEIDQMRASQESIMGDGQEMSQEAPQEMPQQMPQEPQVM